MPQSPRPERLSPVRASVGDVQHSLRRVTARQPLDDHLLFNSRQLPIALRRQPLIDQPNQQLGAIYLGENARQSYRFTERIPRTISNVTGPIMGLVVARSQEPGSLRSSLRSFVFVGARDVAAAYRANYAQPTSREFMALSGEEQAHIPDPNAYSIAGKIGLAAVWAEGYRNQFGQDSVDAFLRSQEWRLRHYRAPELAALNYTLEQSQP